MAKRRKLPSDFYEPIEKKVKEFAKSQSHTDEGVYPITYPDFPEKPKEQLKRYEDVIKFLNERIQFLENKLKSNPNTKSSLDKLYLNSLTKYAESLSLLNSLS